jgi:large subunit ribosomal protein L23
MSSQILKKPLITEKTLYLANKSNAYTFEVDPSATKTQISEAVEKLFGVKVTSIQTVTRGRSMRRTGKRRLTVLVPRKKKAILTLQKGQTIALFDISGAGAETQVAKPVNTVKRTKTVNAAKVEKKK